MASKKCDHIELLLARGFIQLRYEKGKPVLALRGIKEGKSGHLSVNKNWVQVMYCPICGVRCVEYDGR